MKFKTAEEFRADLDALSTDDVVSERDAAFARMAFLRRAASEAARELSADERREFDALEGVVAGLTRLLEDCKPNPPLLAGAIPVRSNTDDLDETYWPVPEQRDAYAPGVPLTREKSFEGFTRATQLVPRPHEGLSLRKALRGVVTGDWIGADNEKRAMSEGVLAGGGYMLPTILTARIIDLARNKTRVMQAGASVVPMPNRTVDVAKWVADPTAAWHSENTAITPSDATIGKVTLTAQSLASLVVCSRELLEDAPNVDDELRNAFAAQFALTFDKAALYGTGTAPEPRGVKTTSGVNVVALGGANGSTPANYDFLVDAVGRLADNNETATAAIYSPRTARTLAKIKDTLGQPMRLPDYLQNLSRLDTAQIGNAFTVGTSSDTSDAFVGDWSQLYLGVRTQLQIQVLAERYADNGQVGFLAWWRGDVAVARAKAFDVTTGIRP